MLAIILAFNIAFDIRHEALNTLEPSDDIIQLCIRIGIGIRI